MNEKTLDAQLKRSSTVVKCEKHGLHYDSSTMSGCVLCRREAAGGATGTRKMATEAASGSLGQALLVTLILLMLTTAGLYLTHGLVVQKLKAWLPEDREETAFDGGFESGVKDLGMPAEPELGD